MNYIELSTGKKINVKSLSDEGLLAFLAAYIKLKRDYMPLYDELVCRPKLFKEYLTTTKNKE